MCIKRGVQERSNQNSSVVTQAYMPSIQEAEAEGIRKGQPGLHGEIIFKKLHSFTQETPTTKHRNHVLLLHVMSPVTLTWEGLD